jgi:gamma-glutamylcyclotransferase (GGCT)/AIG2-like uncharacterized protein YtfP
MSEYLFTYGTLRPEHAPEEIAPTVAKLRAVGKGFVYGTLVDLGAYPGAKLDRTSTTRVFGSVFELPEDPSVLEQLDAYEEFDSSAMEESLFLRTQCDVELESGRTLQCWIYVYNG